MDSSMTGEEVVISGMSGIYPSSKNVKEFMDNLYNQVDMVIEDNMNFDHPEVPRHLGKISDIEKFDAQFFRTTHSQALSLEPLSRKIMEHSYMAIYDAGINPLSYEGTKLGVYVGSSYLDAVNNTLYVPSTLSFIVSGSSRCMMANRVSYFLDSKAPSYTIDCTCASSTVSLEKAFKDIQTGISTAALVIGCQMCLHPYLSLNLRRIGLLCLDGKTKCFDKNADGYVRAEAISVLFLQKAKDAKRIYAEISHAKIKYFSKPEKPLLHPRKVEDMKDFLEEFYSEAGVSPDAVKYVEAHGSAEPQNDTNELEAISAVFSKKRPVKVGCVKSNMGNSEPASAACAVTKMCLAYSTGVIPGNLHYDEPLDTPAVKEGKVQILTENSPFSGGYTAINNFSYAGMFCHILLKDRSKQKNNERYICNIPRLVLVSGREDGNLNNFFGILKSNPIDPELIGMMHNIYKIDTPAHTCRGYTIIDTDAENQTIELHSSTTLYQGGKRPLWIVFSGMGSQFPAMGAGLMHIPIFAAAIERCRQVLEPRGVDIMKILTDPDATMFENVVNCFVGIAAVQIGLIDILKALEIVPDNILGHSLGELACAYFDGCATTEEMILSAYARGLVSIESDFIKGSMAAVGLGYSDALELVPSDIDIACHNSSESCTISGPAASVKSFVKELKDQDIFAKEVACANIPYHSRYIANAKSDFVNRLKEVIKKPVARSEKWICTSLPPEEWDKPAALLSSAEYHANNFTNSVYFEEASKLIPSNAVIVEVAPHGLLQAILKRAHRGCVHIPLTRRSYPNPVQFLLEAFGTLYQEGYNCQIENLYPKIEYPVSSNTSPISHFVEWYHKEDWPIADDTMVGFRYNTQTRRIIISLDDDDYKYLYGNNIEGNIIFPEAAILVLAWETFAMCNDTYYKKMSVGFRDVHFLSDIVIASKEPLKLNVQIHRGDNYFEVTHEKVVVAHGYLYHDMKQKSFTVKNHSVDSKQIAVLNTNDIYKLFSLRDHNYQNEFRSIVSSTLMVDSARIVWNNNWVTFLDALFQLNILARRHDGVSKLKSINQIKITVPEHFNDSSTHPTEVVVEFDELCGTTRCSSVETKDLVFEDTIVKQGNYSVNSLSFTPYMISSYVDVEIGLQVMLQVVADNIYEDVVTVFAVPNPGVANIVDTIKSVSLNVPNLNLKVNEEQENKSNLYVGFSLLKDSNTEIRSSIDKDAFILTFEDSLVDIKADLNFNVISSLKIKGNNLLLLKKKTFNDKNIQFLPVHKTDNFSWFSCLQSGLAKQRKVILVSERKPVCGLIELVKKIRKDFKANIGVVIVEDQVNNFDPENATFKKQLKKGISIQILRKGQWGHYCYLPRHFSSNSKQPQFSLVNQIPGQLDSLKWVELPHEHHHADLVNVHFAGPSSRDAKMVAGLRKTNDDCLGMDYSGIDKKGNRVMGLVANGALASVVHPDLDLLWPVPEHWTLEEAATVPLPYALAAYCLVVRGFVVQRDSIFVTGGAGAIGQAVISLCLSIGCNVFTTVGDRQKKIFLMKLFPKLKENHIGYTYDSSFYNMVIENTNKQRCKIVINCTTGTLKQYATKCVGGTSVFLDLSDYVKHDQSFGMSYLFEEKMYTVVNLDSIFKPKYKNEKKNVAKVITEGISRGFVKPITHVCLNIEDVSRAFKLLSQHKNRGRVLFNIKGDDKKAVVDMIPRMTFSSKGIYVILCDETELGIELAERLLKRGAKNLLLHFRKNPMSGYLCSKLTQWDKFEARFEISTENLKTESDCVQFIKKGNKLGDILGIFVIQHQSKIDAIEQKEFIKAKDDALSVVTYIDQVTRSICPELKHFVILSRFSRCVVDEYTKAELDTICQARADLGLPALMFQLSEENEAEYLKSKNPIKMVTAFNALECCLNDNAVSVFVEDSTKSNLYTKPAEFLKKISSIIGVKNILSHPDDKMCVKDIISKDTAFEELRIAIRENTQLDYKAETIKEMSVARLKSFADVNIKQNTKFDSGLAAFYTTIEKDEYTATTLFIPMLTRLSRYIQTEEQVNANDTYLMLIPGFEGHYKIFTSTCERLKIQAVTNQLEPNYTSSIPEIASGIKKMLTKRFRFQNKFYLMGYSYGINIALEVAALLEKDGLDGVIFCLDSSPDALRVQIDAYLGKLSDQQLQNDIIEHLFYVISKCTIDDHLMQSIKATDDWAEKIRMAISGLRNIVTNSSEYVRATFEAAFSKIVSAKNYQPNFVLNSELVLLKGIPHPNGESLPLDYNLSKYTKKPVKIFEIGSDVACAPKDSRVANVVNQLVDPELIEDFKTHSLCEIYTSDAIMH